MCTWRPRQRGPGLIAWTATGTTTITSPAGATTSVKRTWPTRWIVSTAIQIRPMPHADINRHISRVHCTVCHIPAFARSSPTDMFRDFTTTVPYTPSNRYEPTRTFATNVRPAYAWFNGLSYYYEFGKPITLQSGSKFLMAYPLGDINDSTAKIHAFKLHQAKVGYDLGARRQIPINPRCSGKRVISTRPATGSRRGGLEHLRLLLRHFPAIFFPVPRGGP